MVAEQDSGAHFAPPEEIVTALAAAKSPVLFTHIYPDGDAVGSELGLARGLRSLGASPRILNAHPVAEKYAFLDPDRTVHVVDEKPSDEHRRWVAEADLLVILDTSDPARLGKLEELVFSAEAPRLVVDHHLCRHQETFHYLWSVPRSPSTGNLIVPLLDALEVELTAAIADPLMVALGTDTGWFRFSNSTPEAFRVAARLVAAGADPEGLFGAVFETSSLARMKLLGELLANLGSAADGRIIYGTLRREMLQRWGVDYEETDGFIDQIKAVRGAEIVFLVVELSPTRYKVSLRSKGDREIHTIAERHGGGGHAKAAGCRLEGAEEQVCQTVLNDALDLIQ